ncbi:MAG TPA: hypothetical protein DER01_23220 [Phycisphaerales bacterium]|nr:hypothetical protein [Phycisphaerales bacterium]
MPQAKSAKVLPSICIVPVRDGSTLSGIRSPMRGWRLLKGRFVRESTHGCDARYSSARVRSAFAESGFVFGW